MDLIEFETSIETLSPDECQRLLDSETTGRVAFADGDFPTILPVNYVHVDGLVVFRTDAGAKLERVPMQPVAFEIDGRTDRYAWSVVIHGHAREVTTALGARYEALRSAEIPIVASGGKLHWIAIEITAMSGRCFADRS